MPNLEKQFFKFQLSSYVNTFEKFYIFMHQGSLEFFLSCTKLWVGTVWVVFA